MVSALRAALASACLAAGLTLPLPLGAVELVMVDSASCHYCLEWKEKLGPIYPKTEAGQYAPLRQIDFNAPVPADLTLARKLVFTPTFLLVEDGQELGRIEGYPGEDFFWGLLEQMLRQKTDFGKVVGESDNS